MDKAFQKNVMICVDIEACYQVIAGCRRKSAIANSLDGEHADACCHNRSSIANGRSPYRYPLQDWRHRGARLSIQQNAFGFVTAMRYTKTKNTGAEKDALVLDNNQSAILELGWHSVTLRSHEDSNKEKQRADDNFDNGCILQERLIRQLSITILGCMVC